MEAMRLSLSLAASDVAVVDAQTEIDLSLAASAEAEAEADADSRERTGPGVSTGVGAGLSSPSVLNAAIPGAHGAGTAGINGAAGAGVQAGLHFQAQLLGNAHAKAPQHPAPLSGHHVGDHHLGSSRAQHIGLESTAHLGSNTSGQPWELQLESTALCGFTASPGAVGASAAEPAPQWKAVRERGLGMGHPGRRSSSHPHSSTARGDRSGAEGLGPGGRGQASQGESRAQREKEAAFLGDVLAAVEGRSSKRGAAASARASTASNLSAESLQAGPGPEGGEAGRVLTATEAREQELRAVLNAWGTGGTIGRAELSNVIKALGRRGHTAWALSVFRWMSEQGTVDVSAKGTAPEASAGNGRPVHGTANSRVSVLGAATANAVNGLSVLDPEMGVQDHSADEGTGEAGSSALPSQAVGDVQSHPDLHVGERVHSLSRVAALRPNGHTFSLILGILGRAGQVKEAEEVFSVFRSMGFRDKVHGFNAMLAAYMRQGQDAKAWALFEDMMQAPTAPVAHGPRRGSARSQGGEGQPLAALLSFDSSGPAPNGHTMGGGSGYPHAPGVQEGSAPSMRVAPATGFSAAAGGEAVLPAVPVVLAADRAASPESSWTAQSSLAPLGLGESSVSGVHSGRAVGSPSSSIGGSSYSTPRSSSASPAKYQARGWSAVSGTRGAEGEGGAGEEVESSSDAPGEEAGLHLRRPSTQNSAWHTGGMAGYPGSSTAGVSVSAVAALGAPGRAGGATMGAAPAPDVVSFNTMIGACMPRLHTTHHQPRQLHKPAPQQQVLQQSEGSTAQAPGVLQGSQDPPPLAVAAGTAGLQGQEVPSRGAAGAVAVATAPTMGEEKAVGVPRGSQGLAERPAHQSPEGTRVAAGTGRGGGEAWGMPGPRVAVMRVTNEGGGEDGSEKALWLFFEMQRRRLRPSTRTFNALLGVLGREQRWHHMDAILASMEEHHQQPDMFTYNILISSHCRARRLSEALRFYAEAIAQGLQPTDVTLSALMAGYAAAGRTREALAAFQQLERQQQCQGLRPDTTAFCGLMAVYKEAGRADDAEKTFRRMIAEGAKPNTVAFSCLIHAFGREGRLEDAARVFEEMLGAPESACSPDVQVRKGSTLGEGVD